ncbi:MAG: hypothetical protein ABWY45_05925 [Mycobacterium sp.]
MTVNVTRQDGGNDEYARFGDAFVKNGDGTLDVVRTGSKVPHSYAPGEWTDVAGDERKSGKFRFWR